MTRTSQFLTRTRRLLGLSASSREWKQFIELCTKENAGVWYVLCYRLYLACVGRTFSPKIVKTVMKLIVAGAYADAAGLSEVSTKSWAHVTSILEQDAALPRIQRFFPEIFAKNPGIQKGKLVAPNLKSILQAQPGKSFESNLFQLCAFIAGKYESDLVNELEILAKTLKQRRFHMAIEQYMNVLRNNDKSIDIDSEILKVLRDRAHTYSLVGALSPLPEVPEKQLTLNDPTVILIRDAIIKFSPNNDDTLELRRNTAALEESIKEIQDIFKDMSGGTIRQKYLKLFTQQIRSFGQLLP